ncbi:sodium-coupled monocarboxylate transporter 1-like [Glandiceps talaboti]
MSNASYSLHSVDIVIFIAVLVLVCIQGIYHGWKKQKSTNEYLTGGRSFSGLPVAMSLLLAFLSAITLLGIPAEIYINGLGYSAYILCYLWMYPLIAWLFVPVFHSLPLISAYQYFEMRYNYALRVIMAILFIIQMTLFMAVVMIGPALAFNAVNGFPLYISIIITGCVCMFYTALGGMKAVVWTDVFLFIIILVELVLVITLGTIDTGGFLYIWEVNDVEGRGFDSIFYFPFDVTERITFLNCVFGFGVQYIPVYLNQSNIQRYISTKSTKQARVSVLLNLPFQYIFLPMLYYCGMVLYAFYNNYSTPLQAAINSTFPPALTFPSHGDSNVEPYYEPDYTTSDQILVYFVSDRFGHIPGFMGLFISAIFAGTLSSVSGGINALIAVTLEDFVKPWRRWKARCTGKPLYVNDRVDIIAAKILTIVYGLIAIGVAYVASKLDSLVAMGNTIFGTTGGPMLGAFLLGLLYKRSTAWATICGVVVSFGMICWIFVGSLLYAGRLDEALSIYSLSFMWYATFSCTIAVVVAIPFSEIHRFFSKCEREKSKSVDPALLAVFLRPKGWKSKYVKNDKMGDEETEESDSVDVIVKPSDNKAYDEENNINTRQRQHAFANEDLDNSMSEDFYKDYGNQTTEISRL